MNSLGLKTNSLQELAKYDLDNGTLEGLIKEGHSLSLKDIVGKENVKKVSKQFSLHHKRYNGKRASEYYYIEESLEGHVTMDQHTRHEKYS